ncbi:hypothetical protein L2E82_44859 [Cichorium intybus]|uniref:Uncharacterized protein n=1 Tax=Cichorium intybus TaxID=13427 RepID=A0ACB8ZRL3_CICIN|nr:hypothetical protein L2E82_44859 [Cichorium intybus]
MEEVEEDDEREKWEVDIKTPSTPADSVLFDLSLSIYSVFPFSPSCPSIPIRTPLSRIHRFPVVFPVIETR